jgi:hypothetical protein
MLLAPNSNTPEPITTGNYPLHRDLPKLIGLTREEYLALRDIAAQLPRIGRAS